MTLVTVLSASGRPGLAQVRQLLKAGYSVRATTRNPERMSKFDGIEVVSADYNDPDSIYEACVGADTVFYAGGNDIIDGGNGFDTIDFGVLKKSEINSVTYTNNKYLFNFKNYSLTTSNVEYFLIEKVGYTLQQIYSEKGINLKPVIGSTPISTALEDKFYTYTFTATDPESTKITLSFIHFTHWKIMK